jgi:hypothetical protein
MTVWIRLLGVSRLLVAVVLVGACSADRPPVPVADPAGSREPALLLDPGAVDFGMVPFATEAARTVNLTLVGRDAKVPVLAFDTSSPEFKVTEVHCWLPLVPDETCWLVVTFTPAESGDRRATLTVAGAPLKASATLRGVGLPTSAVYLHPSAGQFEDVSVGLVSASMAFTVTNKGSERAPRPVATVTGSFVVTRDGCVDELAVGSSCTVEVAFAPKTAGLLDGTLRVVSGSVPLTASLGGRGVVDHLTLSLRPTSVEFSATRVGRTSAAQTMKVSNDSSQAVSDLRVAVANSGAFVIPPGGNRCGATLGLGQTCEVDLVFSPAEARRYDAIFVASASGPSATAALSGVGLPAPRALTVTPARLEFHVSVGTSSGALVVHVANPPDNDASPVSVALAGPPASAFSIASHCPAVLPPAQACEVEVTFAPTSTEAAMADLLVTDALGTSVVALVGTSTIDEAGLLEPSQADFGSVVIGTRGPPITFTVKNSGGIATGPMTFHLEGSLANDFVIARDPCTGQSLAPVASCSVDVLFVPKSVGLTNARLVVVANPGGVASAALTGAGLMADAEAIGGPP